MSTTDLETDTNETPNLVEVVHTIRRSWILTIDELRELTGLADGTTEELVAAVSSRIDNMEGYPSPRADEYFEGDEPEGFQDVTMERTARAYYHPSGDADPADFPGDDD